jgi:hypothetical protein
LHLAATMGATDAKRGAGELIEPLESTLRVTA